ncbi:MAG: hypothetical protein QW261_15665 [Candidatus Jordarchaeaceae archaeon]
MSTDEQEFKKIEGKKLGGEVIPILKYECTRLLRKAITPVIVASIAGYLFGIIFGSFPLLTLSSYLQQAIQPLIMPFPVSFSLISEDLLNAIAFIPDPLRIYVALVISARSSLFTAASGINTFLPMCVVPIFFIAMLFTSTLKEEDIYPLLRVDRNKLVLIRSLVNTTFYTIISCLIICLIKLQIVSGNFTVQLVSPFIYALSPVFSPSLILSIFIFLLFLQSLAVIINLYSRRAAYIIPSLLLVELMLLQLPKMWFGAASTSSIMSTQFLVPYIMAGNFDMVIQSLSYSIVGLVLASSPMASLSQVSPFLFLYQLSGLIHTFSPFFGGVWNLSFFDPKYLLQTIVLEMPDAFLFNAVNASFAPYIAIMIIINEWATKTAYYAWFNFLYVGVIPIILYSLATILFGRKTL